MAYEVFTRPIFSGNGVAHSVHNGQALKGLISPTNSVSRSQIPLNVEVLNNLIKILNNQAMFTLPFKLSPVNYLL